MPSPGTIMSKWNIRGRWAIGWYPLFTGNRVSVRHHENQMCYLSILLISSRFLQSIVSLGLVENVWSWRSWCLRWTSWDDSRGVSSLLGQDDDQRIWKPKQIRFQRLPQNSVRLSEIPLEDPCPATLQREKWILPWILICQWKENLVN